MKMNKGLFFAAGASMLLLASCGSKASTSTTTSETAAETTTTEEVPQSTVDPDLIDWDEERLGDAMVDPTDDNYRVFYEIFTGTYSDSDGNGIGDLNGIKNRLDYLNDGDVNSGKSLGIQGIWLTPIFKSSSYHKYDVTDYYTIDSTFGTLDDFKSLLEECHKRNVEVIIDLVINHTSTRNQWFKDFKTAHQNNDTSSPYYDYYTWYDTSAVSGHTLYQISGTNQYYEGNFSSDMPELNYDSDAVYEEMVNVAKYWIDQGVDGFRFDAAKYIYYGDTASNAAFWDMYMADIKSYAQETYSKNLYTVAEVWDSQSVEMAYNTSTNTFDFQTSQSEGYICQAVKTKNGNNYAKYVTGYLNTLAGVNPEAMMIPFITNHDMDRAAGFLSVANKDAYMAANLLILTSGSPFIYYGEEIGEKGSRGSSNTDANRRLAMLWGDGDTVQNPEGSSYSGEQSNGTVASQIDSKSSLLTHYRHLISMRNKYPQIARGTYEYVNNADKLCVFRITYKDEVTYLIHNLSDADVTLDLSTLSATELADFIGLSTASVDSGVLTIGGRTTVIVK